MRNDDSAPGDDRQHLHGGRDDEYDYRDDWPSVYLEERPASGVRSRPGLVAMGGVLVGMLLMAGAWFALGSSGPDDDLSGDRAALGTDASGNASVVRAAGSASPSVLGTEASRPATSTPLDRCRQVAAAQGAPLAAAVPALDQWEVHVGAMNKLVAGAITLGQATAFWNQTRVGAAHHVGAFEAADRRYRQGTGDGSCPAPDQAAKASAAAVACATAVAARDRTIEAAEVAARSWGEHVHHMEMLRTGHLSPSKATRMWIASWHKGVREIARYQEARRGSNGQHC